MDRQIFLLWICLVFCTLACLYSVFLFVWYHEQAHLKIYEYYGIPAHVEFSWFGTAQTVPDVPIDENTNKVLYPFHIMNEMFGYHIVLVIVANFFFTLLILIFLYLLNRKKGG